MHLGFAERNHRDNTAFCRFIELFQDVLRPALDRGNAVDVYDLIQHHVSNLSL